ncbi:unnamed protein product [Paramecium primaurelia]|uniref:Uncharacterized protein n=1 Tax=Paramecium primaurelia TaxID=5886 RepID=A0A8S1K9G5_PARPR|nr:unnamed protein product [Paramecium primaurelia]
MNQYSFCSPKPRFMQVKMDEAEQRSWSKEYKKRSDYFSLFSKPSTSRPQTVDSKVEGNKAIRCNSRKQRQHSLQDPEITCLNQDVQLVDYLFQLKNRQQDRYKSRILKLHEKKTRVWKNYKFPELFQSIKNRNDSFDPLIIFDKKKEPILNYIS